VVTGKPLEVGGSVGRREATARGLLLTTRHALARGVVDGLDGLEGARVAVQGFGNVGRISAELFAGAGARVVAVSDSSGAICAPDGLDLDAVIAHKEECGQVVGLPGTHTLTGDELLEIDCDILVPAALEGALHRGNAARIKARLVVEGANGPTTPAADRILQERGIPVLPDILANAGGVTVSYFEWVQNTQNQKWELSEIDRLLERMVIRATDAVLDEKRRLDDELDEIRAAFEQSGRRLPGGEPLGPAELRTAALVLAIRRVTGVALERGIWP
jgi:glutamate dehydrogenase/leucine dehydrogenase